MAFAVDAGVHAALLRLVRQCRATVFMGLHAGLVLLLSKLGAGDDIVVGTPIAGRTDEALDDLVGCFLNTLVLRTDVSGNPSFRELLGRVRDGDLAASPIRTCPSNGLSRWSTRIVRRPGTHCSRSCSWCRTTPGAAGIYPVYGCVPSPCGSGWPSST